MGQDIKAEIIYPVRGLQSHYVTFNGLSSQTSSLSFSAECCGKITMEILSLNTKGRGFSQTGHNTRMPIFTAMFSSCGKVMFSQTPVILSTGGRCTTPVSRHPPPGQTPTRADTLQADTPRQTPPWADTTLVRHHPGQTPPWAADGTHPTGVHSCANFVLAMPYEIN